MDCDRRSHSLVGIHPRRGCALAWSPYICSFSQYYLMDWDLRWCRCSHARSSTVLWDRHYLRLHAFRFRWRWWFFLWPGGPIYVPLTASEHRCKRGMFPPEVRALQAPNGLSLSRKDTVPAGTVLCDPSSYEINIGRFRYRVERLAAYQVGRIYSATNTRSHRSRFRRCRWLLVRRFRQGSGNGRYRCLLCEGRPSFLARSAFLIFG